MLGFRGVKLPPFFGLQKFFDKYLFKTVIFDSVFSICAYNLRAAGQKKAGTPQWKGCQRLNDFD